MNIQEAITTLPQYILPHHPLSRLMGLLTHSELPAWKNFYIKQIIRHYQVNIEEAADTDINSYRSFNEFFTRALKPEARPINKQAGALVSPADGVISQAGKIAAGDIIQAKGKNYTVIDLLGGDQERAKPFNAGQFATIYLSPKDYHRLHMPVAGTLKEMVHIPGRLFSVNAATTNSVPRLFARNERVACLFDTAAGPMALVLVGAIFVASIETVWHGVVTPPTEKNILTWQYTGSKAPRLKLGEEMGRFNMGSTIIMLFPDKKIAWDKKFITGTNVKLGQLAGSIL